jgi:cyclase
MKVSNHVYCRIGEKGDSNNGVVVCDDCCIVVDTATYPGQTKKDLLNLQKITDKKIKYLINTHYHADHTFGNMYFHDVIAHRFCYETLKERTPFYMKYVEENAEDRNQFEGFTIKLPTLVFEKEIILYYSPEIEVTHYGGHTRGSTTVFIPEENILFSGDLLFVGSHPYLADADIIQWIAALEDLMELDVKKIIPGHGEVCTAKEFEIQVKYLETFYEALRDLKEEYTKEELINNVDLLGLPEMDKQERVIKNIEAHYDRV